MELFRCITCAETKTRFIKSADFPDLKEQLLGNTEYHVSVPNNIIIAEARGKEGQHGFNLLMRDTSKQLHGWYGFIEVESGGGIEGSYDNQDEFVENVSSSILNKKVIWKIRKMIDGSHKGYYYGVAQKGKLSFTAQAATKSGVDSMIAIVSTLHLH